MWHDKHKTECLRIKNKIYRTEKLMKGTNMKKMMIGILKMKKKKK